MEIIAICYLKKEGSIFNKSVFTAFIEPAWAGNHIVEITMTMTTKE